MNNDNDVNNHEDDPNAPIFEAPSIESLTDARLKDKPSVTGFMLANLKRNLASGPGRIVMIVLVAMLVIVLLIVIRGFNKEEAQGEAKPQVDIPTAPRKQKINEEVSTSEHERRKGVNAQKAEKAYENGDSYIPPFDTNVIKNNNTENKILTNTSNENSQLDVPKTYGKEIPQQNKTTQKSLNQLNEQQQKDLMKTYYDEVKNRDGYVNKLQKNTITQIESLIGKDGKGGLNNLGSYTQLTFSSSKNDKETVSGTVLSTTINQSSIQPASSKVLIKTGSTLYGQTNGAVNTDEGMDVFATVVGGEWDGSALLGKVQKTQDNIKLVFTTLSPKDSRPKMKINAIALRIEDAGQGIADVKDYHTVERWGSLAASSLLSGYGQAYQNVGTTTNNGDSTVQTKPEPSNKEIIANMVGQVGSAASSQIAQGFNRPATYSTEEQKPFILYFVDDATISN